MTEVAHSLPPSEPGPARRNNSTFGWMLVILVLPVSALVWDIYPVIMNRHRLNNLERIAPPGSRWKDVKPKVLALGYKIDYLTTGVAVINVQPRQSYLEQRIQHMMWRNLSPENEERFAPFISNPRSALFFHPEPYVVHSISHYGDN